VDHTEIIAPTPERHRHNQIEILDEVVTYRLDDVAERTVSVPRTIDLLADMERRGKISTEMRQGGDDFRAAFHRAHQDNLHACDPARPFVSGLRVESIGGSVQARESVNSALDMLGGRTSEAGSIILHVVGLEMTLKQWAIMRSAQRLRYVSEKLASGILIGALCPLAKFYGHETS
jgi:hypothetical protein